MKRTYTDLYWMFTAAAMLLIITGCDHKRTPNNQMAPPDSPIRVAGGSILVHVYGKWMAGSGSTPSFTSVQAAATVYTQIQIGGFVMADPSTPNAPIPASFSGQPYWQIDILDQNPDASLTEGITLCSNPTCVLSGPPSTTVLLKPLAGSRHSNFYSQPLGDNSSGMGFPAERFYDTAVHQNDGSNGMDSPSNTVDLYERIKTITITVPQYSTSPQKYDCPEGECFIAIGPSPVKP